VLNSLKHNKKTKKGMFEMSKKSYKGFSMAEQKGKLCKQLIQDINKNCSNGGFSKVTVRRAIDTIFEIMDNRRATLTNSQSIKGKVEISVFTNAKKFGDFATENNNTFTHSWAGGDGHTEINTVIVGSLEVGEESCHSYSQNGQFEIPSEIHKMPEFDIDDKIIIIKEIHKWDEYNNPIDPYNFFKYEIGVYLGGEYMFDPEIKEIIEKFGW
jgi:DNA polymerase sigma